MKKQSLSDMLNDNSNKEFTLSFPQNGLNTTVYINKDKKIRSLSADGIQLLYDMSKYNENPQTYITEQLKAHQEYNSLIDQVLSSSYKNVNAIQDKRNNVEVMMQFVPENSSRLFVELTKILLAPIYWVHFKTLKGDIKKQINEDKKEFIAYGATEAVIKYGNNFLDNIRESNDQLSEEVKNNLAEWKKVQENLSWIYSRLVWAAEKKVDEDKIRYKFMFPNSDI